MKIAKIHAREIYDSRGWPTVACDLMLENGMCVSASVPSGISRGPFEAFELRDGGKRLNGKGVLKALQNIEQIIAPAIVGKEVSALDTDLLLLGLDGTTDKSKLGANATLAVSMAVYKAQALAEEVHLFEFIAYCFGAQSVSLPFPLFNIINGGRHANNNLVIQEFLIVPVGLSDFRSAMELGVIVYHALQRHLMSMGRSVAVGDEGGFAAAFESDEEALDILTAVLETVEMDGGGRCVIALDCAASGWYDAQKGLYRVGSRSLNSEELIAWYDNLVESYPIYSIEDGLSHADAHGWSLFMQTLGSRIQIVGDDIFATNTMKIAEGIERDIASAVVIKPNQVGTVTEALQAIKLCKDYGLNSIISHRSGETEESFIADLAVGTSSGQIKAGGPCRSDRLAKYNRLLMIEDTLSLTLLE